MRNRENTQLIPGKLEIVPERREQGGEEYGAFSILSEPSALSWALAGP